MKSYHSIRCIGAIAGIGLGLIAALPADSAILRVPTTAYPTIQAAVDAADTNDTIQIAAGVYTNQVQILSKKLTLIGQPGAILRATKGMSSIQGILGLLYPMMDIRTSDVTVRGLTFEGERLAGRFAAPGELKGILLQQSNADVENCAFYGFRESTPGPQQANALNATGFAAGEVNVRVAGCTFADTYIGIFVIGLPNRQSMNVTVENNTIGGPGPLNSENDYVGILIREGVGGRITGNTISGFSNARTAIGSPISHGISAANQANYPASFGILQPLTIEGNTLQDNQEDIALIKGDNSVVRNNRFQGTAPGFLPLGLAVSGANVTIADNQFEDMPEGIRLLGDDPIFGTLLGAAVDAQVTGNRFCNVPKRLNVEPLANATEVGTLVCPFTPPTVAIAPAAILSWPNYASGSTLESATDVNGAWTPVDATPVIQDGRYTVTVKSDGQRHFYRLRAP